MLHAYKLHLEWKWIDQFLVLEHMVSRNYVFNFASYLISKAYFVAQGEGGARL